MNRAEYRRITQNVSWVLGGQVLLVAGKWLILVIIARHLGARDLGDFGLALSITAPVFMFFDLGLRYLVATDGKASFADYAALRIVSITIATLISVSIAMIAYSASAYTLVILSVAAYKSAETLSDVMYGAAQKYEHLEIQGVSSILRSFIGLGAFYVGILITQKLFVSVLIMAVANGVVAMLYDYPALRRVVGSRERIQPRWKLRRLQRLALRALPLGGTSTVVSLGSNMPRYMLEIYAGRELVGYYTAIVSSLDSVNLLNRALGQATIARLRLAFEKNAQALKRLLHQLMFAGLLLGISATIVCAVIGSDLLEVLFGSEYSSHASLLILGTVAYTASLMNSYVKTTQIVMRLLSPQLAIIAGSVVIGGVVGAFVVPAYGMIGAGIMLIVMYWSSLAIGYLYTRTTLSAGREVQQNH